MHDEDVDFGGTMRFEGVLDIADALDLLDGRLASAPEAHGSGVDRVGNWVRWRLRRPVTADTLRRLRMAGRSVDRHYGL